MCKLFDWRIEFITGGLGLPFDDIIEIAKNVSLVYGEKVWINLGVIPTKRIEELRPYVKGITSSLETVTPNLHDKICPSKPIAPYTQMIQKAQGFQKSICIICGLGDTREDLHYLFEYIQKNKIDRITLYALKPVRGTPHTKAPNSEEYLYWISAIRIQFPKLEIIAGTNLRRCEEAGHYMKAGANALTKFPVTKQFGTKKAHLIRDLIKAEGREFLSNITDLPEINWEKEIGALPIEEKYKEQIHEKIGPYKHQLENPKDKDKKVSAFIVN